MPLDETSQVGMTEYNHLSQAIDFQYFNYTNLIPIPLRTLGLQVAQERIDNVLFTG